MKKQQSKLALLGGKKTIKIKGPHYLWPKINSIVRREVIKQLNTSVSIYDKSGVFAEFEDEFARYHGRKHALLENSGTSAIYTMFIAAGLTQDDEVICPAYTFFATVSPLFFTGAKPVLCDCDENGNIDPEEIKKKITPRTKAIIVTHMWGIPCQMDKIVDICKKNNLLLLEDCSHAHGARYKNKVVGSFGDMAAWSIQGQKNISGGEGGVFATDNDQFYYRALMLGHYNKRCKQEIPKSNPLSEYAVTGMGLKLRAHPLAVRIALYQLRNIDAYRQTRAKHAQLYVDILSKLDGIRLPMIDSVNDPAWYAFVFQYDAEKISGLPLEKFYAALKAEGLCEADLPGSTSPLNLLSLFQDPTPLFPAYKGRWTGYKRGDFPQAEKFYANAVKLPVWACSEDRSMVEKYIEGITKVINNYTELV